jgi:hypothetical protein
MESNEEVEERRWKEYWEWRARMAVDRREGEGQIGRD